jgi:hypothetical protein
VTIVGVGPRGLSALERLICHATVSDGLRLEVLLVEPDDLGVGVHLRDQPAYLLLNTVAAQVTAFSDERMVPGAPVTTGPGFLEWCNANRRAAPDDKPGSCVEAHHFMPRRDYGDYLAWAAAYLLDRTPPNLCVTHVRRAAVAVHAVGRRAEVTLADGSAHACDLAIVTTGHGLQRSLRERPNPPGHVERCYPLPERVAGIAPDTTVAIEGTGLTAVDLVSALTVGRGGVFRASDRGPVYEPSGREPRMLLFNRHGWLPRARPAVPRSVPSNDGPGPTLAAIAAERAGGPGGWLGYEYLQGLIHDAVLDGLNSPTDRRMARRVLGLEYERWSTHADYEAAVVEEARRDLARARRGLVSPIKRRLEALRDRREALRAAVDAPGLTPAGHREFFDEVPSLANRAAVGPQIQRLEELVALIEAGRIRVGPGPSPRVVREDNGWTVTSTRLRRQQRVRVDTLVKANLHWPETDPAVDPVSASLRTWTAPHPSGRPYLRLTRYGQAIDRAGEPHESVAVFGPPAEGSSYYNNYVLWPGAWSRLLTDIDRAIAPLFDEP